VSYLPRLDDRLDGDVSVLEPGRLRTTVLYVPSGTPEQWKVWLDEGFTYER